MVPVPHWETPGIKRITANLPLLLLDAAQRATGEGITETLTLGLEHIIHSEVGRQADSI